MFPLIPLLAIAGILGGSWTLHWYSQLTAEERTEADRLANKIAQDIFGKSLNQLTAAEARQVNALTKSEWMN